MTADRNGDRLLELAGAASDGAPVNWEREAKASDDPEEQRLVRGLGFLASVLDAHHSLHREPGSDPHVGETRTWGELEILGELGRGSFGTVFRARDPRLQRTVALKLRPPGEADSNAVVEEGRMMAKVRHPHVVTVYGSDYRDGRIGLWMELLEGKTLAAILHEQGPMGTGEVVSVGVDLCGALAAVHAAGLVHGDVKAHNVIREAGGRLVLMDFSAGSRQGAAGDLDGVTVSGTPLYMAPEILAGDPRTIASDVYSLGVLLFHLLTGRYPVQANDLDGLRRAHRSGRATPLRDLRPELPVELVALVHRALARDASDRFSSAGELEQALLALRQPASPTARRSPGRVAWALAAAALVVVLAIVGWRMSGNDPIPVFAETVDAGLWQVGTAADRLLADGERIRPGDHLFIELESERQAFVYVVNLDRTGHAYRLFPLPEAQWTNPLGPGRYRLPGETGSEYDSWEVSSAGGVESFLILAAPRPLERLETALARLDRAVPDDSFEAEAEAVEILRGVGKIARTARESAVSDGGRDVVEIMKQLTSSELTREELYLHEIRLENP